MHAVCTSATDAMTASRCKAATNAGRMRRAVATRLRAEVSDKDVLVLTDCADQSVLKIAGLSMQELELNEY